MVKLLKDTSIILDIEYLTNSIKNIILNLK